MRRSSLNRSMLHTKDHHLRLVVRVSCFVEELGELEEPAASALRLTQILDNITVCIRKNG